MRICLLGAQGTGKTTLANLFKGEYKIIDNVARKVIAAGGASNKAGTAKSQKQIFSDYMDALKADEYISTRSVIDVLAYTKYLEYHSKREDLAKIVLEARDEMVRTSLWLRENPDVVICYIPVEFEIEDDGVRSLDKEYQAEIDCLMKHLFDSLDIRHKYIIMGSLQERKQQLAKIIESTKDSQ